MIEVLPCPFCNGKAQLKDCGESDFCENIFGKTGRYWVRCTECGISQNKLYTLERNAVNAWNRRYVTRKYGNWNKFKTEEAFSPEVKCSVCGEVFWAWMADYAFCPNCGSRMGKYDKV